MTGKYGGKVRNLIAAILLSTSVRVNALPYFRLIDPAHPHPVIGALVDPSSPGQTEATTMLPIFTHSPKDGCRIHNLCETWAPLAIGGAINAGNLTFIAAPLFGIAPWVQMLAEKSGVTFIKDPAVSMSFGPAWEYRQANNRGYFRIYSGLSLNF